MTWTTAIILITITILTIVVWLISEFKTQKKWLRCILGILAIIFSVSLTVLIFKDLQSFSSALTKFRYNEFYGETSKKLIDTTVAKLESGEQQKVLNSLKKLQDKFQFTYENKGNYDKLVGDAVKDMEK